MNKNSFMYYPEITDADFNEKIYLKKEFRDTEVKEKKDYKNDLSKKREFLLDPHQIFLKNYISPDTPYNGVLVFHGTGVGKTCTALSIAEGFKKTLKNINKKILILSNLDKNFIKELYDYQKEYRKINPEDVVQCTGKEYELGKESIYLTRSQRERELLSLKKSYYQFFAYRKFANYIIENTGGWKGDEKDVNEKIKKFISKEFDDRVIIIDEIQNIKTDIKEDYTRNIQPILESIIKYGKNIKLILMSATPMFDRPDEIIFYINLLLQNDGRAKINKNDIFNSKDGTLKADAEKKLRELFTGYVSYIRAEKPYIFPFRIYPKQAIIPKVIYNINGDIIESDKRIQFTRLISCPMKNVQLKTYEYYVNNKIKENNIKIKKLNTKIESIENSENSENIFNNSNFYNSNLNNINNTNTVNIKITNTLIENKIIKKSDKKDNILTKISNIVFPMIKHDNSNSNNSNSNNSNSNNSNNSNSNNYKINEIGAYSKSSSNIDYDNGSEGYYRNTTIVGGKKRVQYKYQSHAIFDKNTTKETPFADEKYLENYSSKFASILKTIKYSKGLSFVFSNFIQQGVLSFALMLEQNGFTRDCSNDEIQLLDYNANKLGKGGKRRQICYLCGEDAKYIDHIDEKSKKYHIWKPAKYIIHFGESKDIIKINKYEAVNKFCSHKNRYGEEIKIFIGTRTVSEGLDFKNLRQVHIIEPWYNLSRHEQIIGRAIRNLSHRDLLPEERNVEIYQYVTTFDLSNKNKLNLTETVDLKNYRIAENKDRIIKNITRIMKESAVDCVLFRNSNIIDTNIVEKQITSSGEVLNISIKDKPYSAMCDYRENCNYTCNWMPNPRINYPINTDTYNIRFASTDISKAEKYIKGMFRENLVYHLDYIEKYINNKIPNIDKLFIYTALENIVENKNEIIFDKFSRKGYLIYRGDYYIFQPFDLERDELPLVYRMNPTDFKPNHVDLDNVELNYQNVKREEYKIKLNENKLIENLYKNIDNTYNLNKDIIKNNKITEYYYAIIGSILDKLSHDELLITIQNILYKYFKKTLENNGNYIIKYLNYKNILINYYNDIIHKNSKEEIFIGFIVNKEYYILDTFNKTKDIKSINPNNLKFVECSKDIINQIKMHRTIQKIEGKNKTNEKNKKYNIVYGLIEYDNSKKFKKFKIVDKSEEKQDILTKGKEKSKRSIVTGRICSTFKIDKLMDIRKKIGINISESKMKKIFLICENIEIYLRYKEYTKNDNTIWFEDKE
jgi:hypothetical protein